MKIYFYSFDADDYQHFTWKYDPNNDKWYKFDGTPKGDSWKPEQDIYIANPMNEKGDFVGFVGEIVLSQKALSVLRPVLKPCCEFLDFEYDGEIYTLANVLQKGEFLDHNKVNIDWIDLGDGEMMRGGVDKKIFDPTKLPEHSLFRLEEVHCYGVYTYEGYKENPEEEFKYLVEKHNLKGLYFRLIWDSEA